MVRVHNGKSSPLPSCCGMQSGAVIACAGGWAGLRQSAFVGAAAYSRRSLVPLPFSFVRVAKCSKHGVGLIQPMRSRVPLRMAVLGGNVWDKDKDDDAFDNDASADEDSTFVLEETDHSDTSVVAPSVRPVVVRAPALGLADVVLVGVIVAVVYGLASTAHRVFFSSTPYTALVIDTSLSVLPWYAMQSVMRLLAGYIVSLGFSLGYAYVAYRVPFAAKSLMLVCRLRSLVTTDVCIHSEPYLILGLTCCPPLRFLPPGHRLCWDSRLEQAVDVLQSIPLLSFLPGVVLGLIALFPAGARTGVELAAVLLMFTSMTWNMLLGFYQSLCGIPSDLLDVAETFRLSRWKRFWALELPAGAIGLIWNSIISIAGGWFFLISIESFELGNRDFRLPGLGSYLAAAAEAENYSAVLAGLSTIIVIIVTVDFLVWRPLIAWSSKFKYGGGGSSVDAPRSFVLSVVARSRLARAFIASVLQPAWEDFANFEFPRFPFARALPQKEESEWKAPAYQSGAVAGQSDLKELTGSHRGLGLNTMKIVLARSIQLVLYIVFGLAVSIGVWRAALVMRGITSAQWISLSVAAACTFARVFAALLLSLLWTVPVGIAIGRSPALSARIQPIVQIAASIPATALFPFVLIFLAKLGGGLQVGSIALMMLGTMWYVLFNVIAGTQAIPSELFDVDLIYNRSGSWVRRWRTLILPGIFPYLITGIVTAVGGAWNASIVSEYVMFRGGVMKTRGLGSLISEAAATGNYPLLLAGTLIMSVLVLLTNRFVWGPLYRLAETKYRL